MFPSVVLLNVGGQEFKTLRVTLDQSPFFKALLEDQQDIEGQQPLFVDRDPTYFRHILNWMRGVRFVPSEGDIIRELIEEADYYCLEGFKEHIIRNKSSGMLSTLQGIHWELKRMSG